MVRGKAFIDTLRRKLRAENEKILTHRFLSDCERGAVSLDRLKFFVTQQYYIVRYDLRSLALMLARSPGAEEEELFSALLDGDREALRRLLDLAAELGLSRKAMDNAAPDPRATAYTHYLAWLAVHAGAGEQAAALTVNLPVWGANCRRLSQAFRRSYGIEKTGFLDLFAAPALSLETAAARVIGKHLPGDAARMERCARLIQAYELMFWDSLSG